MMQRTTCVANGSSHANQVKPILRLSLGLLGLLVLLNVLLVIRSINNTIAQALLLFMTSVALPTLQRRADRRKAVVGSILETFVGGTTTAPVVRRVVLAFAMTVAEPPRLLRSSAAALPPIRPSPILSVSFSTVALADTLDSSLGFDAVVDAR